MAISVEALASSAGFFNAVLGYARGMIALYAANPRLASIFSSQQRWLMAQSGLALYHERDPRNPASGLYSGRFVDYIITNEIASRNTAASFTQEMVAYRFARHASDRPDKRARPLEPTEAALEYVWKWLHSHLTILDALDDGARTASLEQRPDLFSRLQPAIAHALVGNDRVRRPGPTFDLFTWVNSGGVVMDDLFSRIAVFDPNAQRAIIGAVSSSDLSERFMISKTHLKRIFSKAAEFGSMGWEGPAGKGSLWLSQGFIREYWDYQAEKFALIDQAYERLAGAFDAATAPAADERALSVTSAGP